MRSGIGLRPARREDAPRSPRSAARTTPGWRQSSFAEADAEGFAEWIAAEWGDGPATLAL